MIEDLGSASRTDVGGSFPRYAAAVQGFTNYWYPVLFGRDLGRKPRAITLCGERIVLVRDRGRVYALHDRCPHRGVPLSTGRRECPGTITCIYHGWTYDLASGRLEAALTDGPESPICGKVSVRTFPAAERAGLIWVYVGDAPAPPVETDIPPALLQPNTVVEGVISRQRGNWRYAAENGVDEGHVRYLHRWTPWTMLREIPAWTRMHMGPSDDGEWLTRIVDEVTWSDTYPRVGRWPRTRPWQSRARGALEIGVRLPCWLRARQRSWTAYEFYVPSDSGHYLSGLLATTQARGLEAARFRAKYRLWFRWLFHGWFHDWDQWIIEQMEIPPERLYRPDVSITAWRRLCEEQARGAPIPAPSARTSAMAANGATPEAYPVNVPV